MNASHALRGTVKSMTDTNDTPRGTLDRIEAFRSYEDGWEDGHRGIGDAVADAAAELARIVGPDLVSAVPFDGAIVLTRRWPVERNVSIRSAEIQPGGLMSLFADPLPQDEMEADDDQPLDLAKAAAWLVADTRTGSSGNPNAAESRTADEEFELAAGDQVEVTTRTGAFVRATWFVSQGGTGFLGLDGDSGRCVTLRGSDSVRVLDAAREAVGACTPDRPDAARVAYEQGRRDMLAECTAIGDEHMTRISYEVEAESDKQRANDLFRNADGIEFLVGELRAMQGRVRESMAWAEMHDAVPAERPASAANHLSPADHYGQVVHTSETPSRAPVRPACGEHGSDHSTCHQDCLGCCGHECDEDCLTIMESRDA